MRALRTLLPAISALAVAAALAGGVRAAPADPAPADAATTDASAAPTAPLADPELSLMRGGFDIGGLSFSFGATLNTLIDGQLALQTVVTYQPGGVTTVVTPGAGVAPVVGDPGLAQLAGRGITVAPGSTPLYATADGATALLQGLTQQGLVNATLNTAANRTVSSNTDLTLVIPNGVAFQNDVLSQHAFQNLSDQIAMGVLANRH